MKRSQLSNALFETAEADARFTNVLKTIQLLQTQAPNDLQPTFVDILDEFRAAQSRLQSAKYDLLILFRTGE